MSNHDAEVEARVDTFLCAGEFREAADAAIRGFGPAILGALVKMMPSRPLAEEAFGEACENIWIGIRSFRKESSFRAWAYRVAYNAAYALLRAPAHKRVQRLDTSDALALADEVSRSASGAAVEEALVDRLRQQLSAEEQLLLTLRVDRELSWQEVAEALSRDEAPVSVGALRVRFTRLLARLKAAAADGSH